MLYTLKAYPVLIFVVVRVDQTFVLSEFWHVHLLVTVDQHLQPDRKITTSSIQTGYDQSYEDSCLQNRPILLNCIEISDSLLKCWSSVLLRTSYPPGILQTRSGENHYKKDAHIVTVWDSTNDILDWSLVPPITQSSMSNWMACCLNYVSTKPCIHATNMQA